MQEDEDGNGFGDACDVFCPWQNLSGPFRSGACLRNIPLSPNFDLFVDLEFGGGLLPVPCLADGPGCRELLTLSCDRYRSGAAGCSAGGQIDRLNLKGDLLETYPVDGTAIGVSYLGDVNGDKVQDWLSVVHSAAGDSVLTAYAGASGKPLWTKSLQGVNAKHLSVGGGFFAISLESQAGSEIRVFDHAGAPLSTIATPGAQAARLAAVGQNLVTSVQGEKGKPELGVHSLQGQRLSVLSASALEGVSVTDQVLLGFQNWLLLGHQTTLQEGNIVNSVVPIAVLKDGKLEPSAEFLPSKAASPTRPAFSLTLILALFLLLAIVGLWIWRFRRGRGRPAPTSP